MLPFTENVTIACNDDLTARGEDPIRFLLPQNTLMMRSQVSSTCLKIRHDRYTKVLFKPFHRLIRLRRCLLAV